MSKLTLYGSLTSPYVRRVRIVALELNIETDFVDVTGAEGQQRLRELTPLWKVPVAEYQNTLLFDSSVISAELLRDSGPGPFADLSSAAPEIANRLTVIDGVLDSMINTMYLGRDGVLPHQASYLKKQQQRAEAGLSWLEQRLNGAWLTDLGKLSLCEVNLLTALEWMQFRDAFPVDTHPQLMSFLKAHSERTSFRETAPTAAKP